MATKLFLVPFPTKLLFPRAPTLPQSPFSSFSSSTNTLITPRALSQFQDPSFFYGPSLDRGTVPFQSQKLPPQEPEEPYEINGDAFERDRFTRVFELSALRVPSRDCFAIENRLRGHLLNWPRIGNIARVAGDEMEEEFAKLVGESGNGDEGERLDALNRRIYGKAEGDGEDLGPVLYREKLVKTFDVLGYVKFRNLAKLSRPARKKKGVEGGEELVGRQKIWKNDIFMVEVVEEEEEDFRGLLGDDFRGRTWRGSTRLLLLDEQYGDKSMDDLPEAIKVVLKEHTRESTIPNFELVRCKLTLFYAYWPINEILKALLPKGALIPSTFEAVGHIAHLNLRDELLPYKKLIAQVILDKNKTKIKTVVNKIDPIHNDFRTMDLEVLAGNHSLVTTVVENGLRFEVDFGKVYWNSRLATERQRLLKDFTHNDVVCDVFSGVGPIAIAAGKIVKCVYANDLNPQAIEYLERNTLLNKVEKKVKVFNMDGRRFIDAMFRSDQYRPITQVVMNLPNSAVEYLDVFRGIFNDRLKNKELVFPKIHVYGFSRASDPEFDFHERIRIALAEVAVDVEMRIVRDVAPGKPMLCASFILPESVAFAKPVSST